MSPKYILFKITDNQFDKLKELKELLPKEDFINELMKWADRIYKEIAIEYSGSEIYIIEGD